MFTGRALTVDDADLAPLVLCAQRDGVALLGRHDAYGAQAVGALDVGVVVGIVLAQEGLGAVGAQRGLDGVAAVRLVLPCHHGGLGGGGNLVVTVQDDGLEEDGDVALGGTLHRDGPGVVCGRGHTTATTQRLQTSVFRQTVGKHEGVDLYNPGMSHQHHHLLKRVSLGRNSSIYNPLFTIPYDSRII